MSVNRICGESRLSIEKKIEIDSGADRTFSNAVTFEDWREGEAGYKVSRPIINKIRVSFYLRNVSHGKKQIHVFKSVSPILFRGNTLMSSLNKI